MHVNVKIKFASGQTQEFIYSWVNLHWCVFAFACGLRLLHACKFGACELDFKHFTVYKVYRQYAIFVQAVRPNRIGA